MLDQYGRWFPDYPGQQPYQDPAYMRNLTQQQNHSQQVQTPQDMTPTIHAEIKQVDSFEAIDRIPLGAGTSQMFMTKDEKNIIIRTMYANGQHSDVVYDKRPPLPPEPKINPEDYVRREEIPALVSEALAAEISRRQKKENE